MQSSHPGRRAARTATSALLAASIAGTIVASVLADGGRHPAAPAPADQAAAPAQPATTAPAQPATTAPAQPATTAPAGRTAAPVLNPGSGTRAHARSSAS